jgi:hypothetical protein
LVRFEVRVEAREGLTGIFMVVSLVSLVVLILGGCWVRDA